MADIDPQDPASDVPETPVQKKIGKGNSDTTEKNPDGKNMPNNPIRSLIPKGPGGFMSNIITTILILILLMSGYSLIESHVKEGRQYLAHAGSNGRARWQHHLHNGRRERSSALLPGWRAEDVHERSRPGTHRDARRVRRDARPARQGAYHDRDPSLVSAITSVCLRRCLLPIILLLTISLLLFHSPSTGSRHAGIHVRAVKSTP